MAWTTPTTRTTSTLITAAIWNTDLVDNLVYLYGLPVSDAIVYKSSDETLSSSTTLQNDNLLLWALTANKTYWFNIFLYLNGNATMDFKCGWTLPASATMLWGHFATSSTIASGSLTIVSPASTQDVPSTEASTISIGMSSGNQLTTFQGLVFCAGTAGNAQFQWAQDTSNGSNLTVKAGSFIKYKQLN